MIRARAAFAISVLGLAIAPGCRCGTRADSALAVPRVTAPIRCDGQLDETDWRRPARTGPFVDPTNGGAQRPYSDARFLRDGEHLYVALYAADEDMRSTEEFVLVLEPEGRPGPYEYRFLSTGAVRPATAGIATGVDRDGTLDDPRDDDEEWVIEASIPLASLHIRGDEDVTLRARASRCDTPRDGHTRCGAWRGRLHLGRR